MGHSFQVFPVAYAVMTSKSETAYQAIFERLKELGLDPKFVCTDWEKAEQNGWKLAFPNVELWGCLFHYQRLRIYFILTNLKLI